MTPQKLSQVVERVVVGKAVTSTLQISALGIMFIVFFKALIIFGRQD
jgi:hypothetical protein